MVLIECFTKSHIDNISACLRLRPETLVFLGDSETVRRTLPAYRTLLKKRNQHTEILFHNTAGIAFADICKTIFQLLDTDEECIIDLSGGDEPVIMAVGAVVAQLDDRRRGQVQVQKYNAATDTVQDCLSNHPIPGRTAYLSVEELVILHGGILYPDNFQPPMDFTPTDLENLWQMVAQDPKYWNRAVTLLAEFESHADSRNQVYLPLQHLQHSISNYPEKASILLPLLEQFLEKGIIRGHIRQNALEYTYTSPMHRYCTQKAGNVLEVKTLLEARSLLDNGAPYFQDCQMGVSIDWDGIVHDPARRIPETRNEIDVLLMHGTTPLFVSCKNGSIGEDELYKLHTVATQFAGQNVKKMLIATDLEQISGNASRSIIQRAWDMDIFPVTDAASLSSEEWRDIFRQATE